jgi:drug/metabolite transporter (DMT)-like permease
MFLVYFSVTLAIIATTLYHIVQKLTPSDANPAITLFITYFTSAILCLFLLPFYPLKDGLTSALKQLNWTTFGLGFALVGLELGFLLAYRAGWNISVAALIVNIVATLLLVIIGVFFLKDKVGTINLLGMVVCVLGLIMVNYKS